MRATSLTAAAAVVFGLAIGSVSAADRFVTLGGVAAAPMSSGEMSRIVGGDDHFGIVNVHWPTVDINGPFNAPGTSPVFTAGEADNFCTRGPGCWSPGLVGIWQAEQAGGAVYVRCGDGGLTGKC